MSSYIDPAKIAEAEERRLKAVADREKTEPSQEILTIAGPLRSTKVITVREIVEPEPEPAPPQPPVTYGPGDMYESTDPVGYTGPLLDAQTDRGAPPPITGPYDNIQPVHIETILHGADSGMKQHEYGDHVDTNLPVSHFQIDTYDEKGMMITKATTGASTVFNNTFDEINKWDNPHAEHHLHISDTITGRGLDSADAAEHFEYVMKWRAPGGGYLTLSENALNQLAKAGVDVSAYYDSGRPIVGQRTKDSGEVKYETYDEFADHFSKYSNPFKKAEKVRGRGHTGAASPTPSTPRPSDDLGYFGAGNIQPWTISDDKGIGWITQRKQTGSDAHRPGPTQTTTYSRKTTPRNMGYLDINTEILTGNLASPDMSFPYTPPKKTSKTPTPSPIIPPLGEPESRIGHGDFNIMSIPTTKKKNGIGTRNEPYNLFSMGSNFLNFNISANTLNGNGNGKRNGNGKKNGTSNRTDPYNLFDTGKGFLNFNISANTINGNGNGKRKNKGYWGW
jgi:hypothetical protein